MPRDNVVALESDDIPLAFNVRVRYCCLLCDVQEI
jgi:hypothetical protein